VGFICLSSIRCGVTETETETEKKTKTETEPETETEAEHIARRRSSRFLSYPPEGAEIGLATM
jgi:hypothetical protein